MDIVTLNVGGIKYTTTKTTLAKFPNSMLGLMFASDLPSARMPDGSIFIDRDGSTFRHVLNYLRCGSVVESLDQSEIAMLRREAEFYLLDELSEQLKPPTIYEIEITETQTADDYEVSLSVSGSLDKIRRFFKGGISRISDKEIQTLSWKNSSPLLKRELCFNLLNDGWESFPAVVEQFQQFQRFPANDLGNEDGRFSRKVELWRHVGRFLEDPPTIEISDRPTSWSS